MTRELERSERWSSERLRELQWERQVRLVRHAFAHIPFYRERWEAVGLSPGDLRTEADWARLPVLEKRDLQEHGASMRWRRPVRGLAATTSGSSGTPVSVFRSHRSWAHSHANVFRGWRWHGLGVGDRYALFWGLAFDPVNRGRARVRDWFFNRERCSAFSLDSTTAAVFYQRLRQHPTRFAFGYASALTQFAEEIDALGRDGRALGWRRIVTSAETLYPHQRKRLNEVFGCPVVDSYGCAEVGVAGFECGFGTMHVPVESVVLEHHATPGGGSQILLTDLHNLAQPIIRYRVGDCGEPGEPWWRRWLGRCSCGLGLPAIRGIIGRAGSAIELPGGRQVNPNLPSYILKRHGLAGTVREYQFLQFPRARVELRVVAGPAWTEEVHGSLTAEVRETLGVEVPIRLVERCERGGRGKHCDFLQVEEERCERPATTHDPDDEPQPRVSSYFDRPCV